MKRTFDETFGQHWQRIRAGCGRVPLRTIQELAEEFGVDFRVLGKLMKNDQSAPAPTINNNNTRHAASRVQWFKPADVRRWWASTKGQS